MGRESFEKAQHCDRLGADGLGPSKEGVPEATNTPDSIRLGWSLTQGEQAFRRVSQTISNEPGLLLPLVQHVGARPHSKL